MEGGQGSSPLSVAGGGVKKLEQHSIVGVLATALMARPGNGILTDYGQSTLELKTRCLCTYE